MQARTVLHDYLRVNAAVNALRCCEREVNCLDGENKDWSVQKDGDGIVERAAIIDAIRSGDIKLAMETFERALEHVQAKVDEAERQSMQHDLKVQQLIELIRQRSPDALATAQQLASNIMDEPIRLQELEETLALLAYSKPEESPFKEVLSLARREKLALEINAMLLRAQTGQTEPRLATMIKHIIHSHLKHDELPDILRSVVFDPINDLTSPVGKNAFQLKLAAPSESINVLDRSPVLCSFNISDAELSEEGS